VIRKRPTKLILHAADAIMRPPVVQQALISALRKQMCYASAQLCAETDFIRGTWKDRRTTDQTSLWIVMHLDQRKQQQWQPYGLCGSDDTGSLAGTALGRHFKLQMIPFSQHWLVLAQPSSLVTTEESYARSMTRKSISQRISSFQLHQTFKKGIILLLLVSQTIVKIN